MEPMVFSPTSTTHSGREFCLPCAADPYGLWVHTYIREQVDAMTAQLDEVEIPSSNPAVSCPGIWTEGTNQEKTMKRVILLSGTQ